MKYYQNSSIFFTILLVTSFANVGNTQLTTGCHDYDAVIENTVQLDPQQYEGVWFELYSQ
jgi:hypothetical protein